MTNSPQSTSPVTELADYFAERDPDPAGDIVVMMVPKQRDLIVAALRAYAQTPANTLEVRQHIAWLFQYVQGMNERNWRDMKLRAERQLEQLSLAFPGTSNTSTVQPQADWNFGDTKPGQLGGPSTKD